eukprot:10922135-Alexandrium_andersonii.AAC.1
MPTGSIDNVDVSYVDDLSHMFEAPSRRELLERATALSTIVVDVYWGLGLRLNMAPSKTALLFA